MNVVHLVSNKVWGGGERYVLDLCRGLSARGHHPQVITRRADAVSRPFAAEGFLVGTLRLGGVLDVVSPILLAKHLDTLDGPVVVHTHNFKTARLALTARRLMRTDRSRVRVVCTRHLVKPAATGASARRMYAELDAIIFVSQIALDAFLSTGPAVDRSRLHVMHNAIPLAATETPAQPHDGPARIIFVGRLDPEKGVDTLLGALGRLGSRNDWTLEICGTGRARYVAQLMQTASYEGIADRITWSGFVADPASHISAADMLVAPTTAQESFGLVLLEAFAKGVPVITTDNGAQPEIITDGTDGLLVPPADAAALASAIARLLDSPTLRGRMGDAALDAYRTRFGYDRFLNAIIDVYR